VPPRAELDLLAVDQDQRAVRRQRAVRGDQVEGVRLPAAWLAAEQHVPLGEVHVDVLAVLVDPQMDRVGDRQREHRGAGHGRFSFHALLEAGPGGWVRGAAVRVAWRVLAA